MGRGSVGFRNVAVQPGGGQTVVTGFSNGTVSVDRPRSGNTAGVNSSRTTDTANFNRAAERLGATEARRAIGNNIAQRLGIADTHEVRVASDPTGRTPSATNNRGGRARPDNGTVSAIITPRGSTPPDRTRIPASTSQLASALSSATRDVANGR